MKEDSFPMFARCSLRQWSGYPKMMKAAMDISESAWAIYSAYSHEIHPPGTQYKIWQVTGLPEHQGTLIKVIFE